jgi:hypothetical protein
MEADKEALQGSESRLQQLEKEHQQLHDEHKALQHICNLQSPARLLSQSVQSDTTPKVPKKTAAQSESSADPEQKANRRDAAVTTASQCLRSAVRANVDHTATMGDEACEYSLALGACDCCTQPEPCWVG